MKNPFVLKKITGEVVKRNIETCPKAERLARQINTDLFNLGGFSYGGHPDSVSIDKIETKVRRKRILRLSLY